MRRPRILIPVPTSFDEPYNTQCWPEYASAVEQAGGEAVKLVLGQTLTKLQEIAAGFDGILLPGSGADVSPERYGHERLEACAAPDGLREAADFALLEMAERLRKPALCVCFGTQSLNVFRGGTLVQDLPPVPVNHRAGRGVAVAHAVQYAKDSRFGRILAAAGESVPVDEEFARVGVNSSHHQALAIPGDGLRVVARSPEDAVIEAVEGSDPDHWLLGVQWHPERTYGLSAVSRAIFSDFLQAMRHDGAELQATGS